MTDGAARLHATVVARRWRAVLLVGPSGSGKSDLALRLLDRGWLLVADDQVWCESGPDGRPRALPPPALAGLVEIYGVGLAIRPYIAGVPVALAVDLVRVPPRMPGPPRRGEPRAGPQPAPATAAATMPVAGQLVPMIGLRPFEPSAPLKVEAALAWCESGAGACHG
jgi:hypothetical protein